MNRYSALTSFTELFPPDDRSRSFRDPSQLIGWLHAPGQDAETKNDVLSHLLRAAGGKDRAGELAVELLLLALWPGLCVVRRRLWPLCWGGTLDADLLSELTVGIRRARPDRITRVAATLLRNLERDLRRLYIRDDQVTRHSIDLDTVGHLLVQHEADRPDVILSAAQAALGPDGVLLAAVYIARFTQKEAAARLGISHEATRKRCQRALARLKKNFDG